MSRWSDFYAPTNSVDFAMDRQLGRMDMDDGVKKISGQRWRIFLRFQGSRIWARWSHSMICLWMMWAPIRWHSNPWIYTTVTKKFAIFSPIHVFFCMDTQYSFFYVREPRMTLRRSKQLQVAPRKKLKKIWATYDTQTLLYCLFTPHYSECEHGEGVGVYATLMQSDTLLPYGWGKTDTSPGGLVYAKKQRTWV